MELAACSRCRTSQHRRQRSSWLLVLGVLLLAARLPGGAMAAHVHATKQMRDHIQQWVTQLQPERDYLGDVSDHLRVAWSHDLGLSINDTVAAMAHLSVPIRVDVKVVGFGGDGNEALHIAEHDLQIYLKSLHNQLDTVALHPEPGQMPLKPEIEFQVQPAYYELAPKLWDAINQGVNAGHTSNYYGSYLLHLVDYEAVDKLIEEDFGHGDGTYTIYLLNPPSHTPYAYVYPHGIYDTDFCPGSLWVSDKRYAWFDLTANLTFYGPGPGGKGQVFSHSTPILSHYKPSARARAILPDLASLVWTACQHLVWPPLHHGDLTYYKQLDVHLIYMVEGLTKPSPGDGRVDVGQLHTELQTIGDIAGQEISVLEHIMLFADCDHCVTAYSGALKAKTARQPGHREFRLSTSHYIDLPDLERWLTEWREVLLSEAGINWDEGGSKGILPVFIFDLPSLEPILLDGVMQAAALKNGDVVAVRSAGHTMPTFYGCFEHQMNLNPKSIHRPVLASVLQAAYGVADTSLYWSQATGKGWNFVWSIGQTPFGALSNLPSLSFVQRDAAVRNLAASYLNTSISHAALLVRGFEWLAPMDAGTQTVKSFLQPEQVIPYQQRISLLLFKLQEAAKALGSQQHALALGYAASTIHDVTALHKIVRQYKETLNPDLVCAGVEKQARWWMWVAACVLITAVLVVWRWVRGEDGEDGGMGTMSGHSSRRTSLTDRLSSFGGGIKSPIMGASAGGLRY